MSDDAAAVVVGTGIAQAVFDAVQNARMERDPTRAALAAEPGAGRDDGGVDHGAAPRRQPRGGATKRDLLLRLAVLGLACLLSLGGMVVVERLLIRPMRAITRAMAALAAGGERVAIGGTTRADESGALAKAFAVFREELIRRRARRPEHRLPAFVGERQRDRGGRVVDPAGTGTAVEHLRVEAAGASFHVAQQGSGPPLLLLHGWPEFSLTWEPVMARLADRFTLIAPDLRGFGDSTKPGRPWGSAAHAADMLALLDALAIERVGIVGHDVGGAVMHALACAAEKGGTTGRLAGLFFFDFAYPGIGPRAGAPDRLAEIWYQSFHLLDLAPRLVGSSREACRAYIGHFLQHWAHRRQAFDDVLEAWVDTFMKPGNLEGGFAYYQGAQESRLAIMRGEAPPLPVVSSPTCVRWAAHDPIFPAGWTDRLGDYFADLEVAMMDGVGHFPHREDPARAAEAIAGFFARIGWSGP